MATHVALLRGINVGGHNKVAMSDLRDLAVGLGYAEVATYIQSGNLVFSTAETDAAQLADTLEREIAARLGVRPAVVVVSAAELAQVIAHNPFPAEANPRCLHAVFRRDAMGPADIAAIAGAVQRARAAGSDDDATVVGRTLYLRTPDGLGRSDLAAQLLNSRAQSTGTARNWATVTRLIAMLNAAS